MNKEQRPLILRPADLTWMVQIWTVEYDALGTIINAVSRSWFSGQTPMSI